MIVKDVLNTVTTNTTPENNIKMKNNFFALYDSMQMDNNVGEICMCTIKQNGMQLSSSDDNVTIDIKKPSHINNNFNDGIHVTPLDQDI